MMDAKTVWRWVQRTLPDTLTKAAQDGTMDTVLRDLADAWDKDPAVIGWRATVRPPEPAEDAAEEPTKKTRKTKPTPAE